MNIIKNFKVLPFFLLFFLPLLGISSLFPIDMVQAASDSTQFYNAEGTRFTIKATIVSIYPNSGSNTIQFEATLDQLRPDAYDVHDIVVSFRVGSYDTGSSGLAPLSFVGDKSYGSSNFDYNPTWGEVNLQISVSWREDIPLSIDPQWSTNWVTSFTLKPSNFMTENYYIFIIIGAVVVLGIIGAIISSQKRKKTTVTQITLQQSFTQPQTQSSTKMLIFCPNCGTQLKEITQFCPSCGGKL